jgi:hypothetical protein
MSLGAERQSFAKARQLSAAEARTLTTNCLTANVATDFLPLLLDRIRKTSIAGQFELVHPFRQLETTTQAVTPVVEQELRRKLAELGYTVVDHPDPDPGHPGSSAYTTVSW